MKTVKPVVKSALEAIIYCITINHYDNDEGFDYILKLIEEIINDESLIEEKKGE